MKTKNFHGKAGGIEGLEHLAIEDHHIHTEQKASKYYSNYDDVTVKKKL